MNIYYLVILIFAFLFLGFSLYEDYEKISRIIFSICIAILLWGTFAMTNHKQNMKFVYKIPVYIQDKIAFSTFKNNLINCSDKFNAQFKQGDSICVFEEIDTWVNGTKWSGGDYVFRLERDGKK